MSNLKSTTQRLETRFLVMVTQPGRHGTIDMMLGVYRFDLETGKQVSRDEPAHLDSETRLIARRHARSQFAEYLDSIIEPSEA